MSKLIQLNENLKCKVCGRHSLLPDTYLNSYQIQQLSNKKIAKDQLITIWRCRNSNCLADFAEVK